MERKQIKEMVYNITITKRFFKNGSEETLNFTGKCDESMAKLIANHALSMIKQIHIN